MMLEVNDLKTYYYTRGGVVRSVDGISFGIRKGSSFGLVGESGCGKTTTGMSLINLLSPPGRIVGGEINIDGKDISKLSENELRKNIRWKKISVIFQGAMNCLTPAYTIGRQMCETILHHTKMTDEEAMERAKKYIKLVGLNEKVVDRYPHELSGGMKQRVVIASALLLEPKLVICDEPTTALDVIVQAQIMNLLKELKKKLGLSYLFITHDLATEAEVANRMGVMYAGKLVEIGRNEQIYGGSDLHPYTEKLLGSIPRLHLKIDKLEFIPGTPPNLLDPPSGCRFHPRCKFAKEICRKKEPELIEVEEGHKIACHLYR